MIDDRPTDEIEPLVPVMPQSRVRPDGGVLRNDRRGPDVLPAEERYTIDPLVPDLS
ncbi:hypothetical protein [Halocatena salina]|uniref:Uncharacterized protein n=1 Tax=Halocatena salina TaxID=2934340 RepID=A0A8T9ZYQ6_9EURY|nr:hypothetical protein [Halocatena salina]UPM41842.1 hypothetical protein MW046_07555 [Halocatena salina]